MKRADQVPAFLWDEVPSSSLGPASAQKFPCPGMPLLSFTQADSQGQVEVLSQLCKALTVLVIPFSLLFKQHPTLRAPQATGQRAALPPL